MPLPDERPRQSVANLIGKFETQTKRLSLSASSPSRSSSVVSHITGDSTNEEAKERREWPPKSHIEATQRQPMIAPSAYSRHVPAPLITPSVSKLSSSSGELKKQDSSNAEAAEVEVPLTAKALNASQRQVKAEPNSFLENWRKDLPAAQGDMEPPVPPDAAKQEPVVVADAGAVTPTLATAKKLVTPSTPRSSNAASKTTAPRLGASVSSKPVSTPLKTPVKSVLKSASSRQSLTSAAAQPLKPQHTGQSVASSATARRPAVKPPPTPVSTKTPARSEPASRSKTPTSSRPKTPSSGLFAPTAASLAKSRNAAPAMPTPIKKSHLSSSSMDRLSKPTAASQARMAAAAANTSRSITPAAKTSTVKAKVPPAPKPAKKETVVPRAPTAAVVAASVAAIGLAAAAADLIDEEVAQTVEATAEASEVEDVPSEVPEVKTTQSDSNVAPDEVQAPTETELTIEVEETEEIANAENDVTPRSSSPAPVSEAEVPLLETPEEPTSERQNVDQLEDIVNLLESVSISKPHTDTTADIPDEILEIPDEDER